MTGLVRVFTAVLNMSVTASYVAAGVLLVRLLLDRAPRSYAYALWSAVLARMVMPATITSAFSLLGFLHVSGDGGAGRFEYVPQSIGLMKQPSATTGIAALDRTANASLPPAAAVAGVNPMQLVMAAAGTVWAVGFALLLLHAVVSYMRMAERVRTATLLADGVYETDRIAAPFVFGFVRPRIYVPAGLGAEELRYIVEHERTHIRRRDYLAKPIAYLALLAHWFNPLLWLSFQAMTKDMEMACDERALRSLGETGRQGYSRTLLALSTGKRRWSGGGPLTFGENHVASRIKRVIRYRRPGARTTAIVFLAVAAVIAGLVVNPRPDPGRGRDAAPAPAAAAGDDPAGELYGFRTPYVGNASRVGSIVGRLPLPEGLVRSTMELQTKAPPYGLTIRYRADGPASAEADRQRNAVFARNAAIVFSLVGNVDTVSADVAGSGAGDEGDRAVYTFTRGQIEAMLGGDVRLYAADEAGFAEYAERVSRLAMDEGGTVGELLPEADGTYVLSANRIELAGGGVLELRVEMTEGARRTEAEAGGPGGGIYPDNYEGTYRLRVVNPALSTVFGAASVYEGLAADFGEAKLVFGGPFKLALADYNGDGRPDFTLGQWGGSNGNVYRLYTLDERGRIEKLDTGGGELYVADHSPSTPLERVGENGFALRYYDQSSGEYKRHVYRWDGSRFALTDE